MNLDQYLDHIKTRSLLSGTISAWHRQKPSPPKYSPFPTWVNPTLTSALSTHGINRLYTHQRAAIDAIHTHNPTVIVTPTASGKTLCYNIPVINRLLADTSRRALYLFPTKALAQDQLSELQSLLSLVSDDLKVHTYDGDTPAEARPKIRTAANIVVTNPDMLHTAILPHHTKWMRLFENLDFIVIDELHQYRGVFGSHFANVIRRLQRICSFYNSNPTFILCSATIANPDQLAKSIIGTDVTTINTCGAPQGEKNIIIYNPPVVNQQLGIRRSSIIEASTLATDLIKQNISTIVFARSRLAVEIILTYIRRKLGKNYHLVAGYRGGYLPRQRRDIERKLRQGTIKGVVSTNALELGIDIGSLQCAILAGYPGTIASFSQQIGRAGRRTDTSAAFLITSSNPLDQFIAAHPDYLLGNSPEHGLINPENLHILASHLKCGAFELPFTDTDQFGPQATKELLDYLTDQDILRHTANRYYWMAESFPAIDVSLRSASTENVVIIERSSGRDRLIGEVDRFSAPMLVHDEAIYIHDGVQYQVEKLDLNLNKAFVRQDTVDYYTDANLAVNLSVIDVEAQQHHHNYTAAKGEVNVTALATIFKKIKLHTHENVGWGKIHLPEDQMHTQACWFQLTDTPTMTTDQLQQTLLGAANALNNVAPLLLMADPRDIHTLPQIRSPFTDKPTIYIYDSYPGGIGLSHKLYTISSQLWSMAHQLVSDCICDHGCPSCIIGHADSADKQLVLTLLSSLAGDNNVAPQQA